MPPKKKRRIIGTIKGMGKKLFGSKNNSFHSKDSIAAAEEVNELVGHLKNFAPTDGYKGIQPTITVKRYDDDYDDKYFLPIIPTISQGR